MKMRKIKVSAAAVLLLFCLIPLNQSFAGIYSVDDWIDKDDPGIAGWATGWKDYNIGADVDTDWRNPENALGQAEGTSFDIVSLGRGGSITLTFNAPIVNGIGADFAVFENSFSETFLELAYVEVSSDGKSFVRFDNDSATINPVGGFGTIDPGNLYQLAGKHMQGKGTLFDLNTLQYNVGDDPSALDLDNIHYVRLVDIVGDGTYMDTYGGIIYDPYPTTGSAGFDLDAIGVLNQGDAGSAVPLPGALLLLGSGVLGLAGLKRRAD